MFSTDRSEVRDALAHDGQSAGALLRQLEGAGRAHHPAVPLLQSIIEPDQGADALIHIAAVAFEAGVRVSLASAIAPDGIVVEDLGAHAHLLRDRPPMPWEPDEALAIPYREIDWRAAVAEAGARWASEAFAVPSHVPGAALVGAFARVGSPPEDILPALLGEAPRDDVLDPVAAGGNFLAQIIPGYVDLDMALREHREQEIENARAGILGVEVTSAP